MALKGTRFARAITVGLVLVFAHAFLYFNASAFADDADAYRRGILVYMIGMAFIFAIGSPASRRTTDPLFTAPFFSKQGIGRFAIAAFVTLLILIPFGLLLKPASAGAVFAAVSSVGVGLALFHALIVSFDEELIFRGRLTNELRGRRLPNTATTWIQAILFALFHYAVAGGEFLLLLVYVPLGIIFLYVKDRFSPTTYMANIGVHFAWNLFILGFIQAVV